MKISPDKRTELNMRKLLLWLRGSPMPGHGPSATLIKSARFPRCLPGSAPLMSERLGPGSPLNRGKESACRAARAAAQCPRGSEDGDVSPGPPGESTPGLKQGERPGLGRGRRRLWAPHRAGPTAPASARSPAAAPLAPGCQENREN